ncbi:MAG: 5'/3'-nucleotidase SurE [Gemmataceae bacterium]
MRFLITNDDGIEAPGIQALIDLASELGDVKVVAPLKEHSGCSHATTTRRPVRVHSQQTNRTAIEGTPVDCVRLGLHHLAPETDWVLSGINSGGNLGADIHVSGTVAAVREGTLRGIPGIAFSHYKTKEFVIDWELAKRRVFPIIQELLERSCKPGTFWNVNLPALAVAPVDPKPIYCPVDPNPLPADYQLEGEHFHYRGNYHGRARNSGSDVDVCFSGNIAVSPVRVHCDCE